MDFCNGFPVNGNSFKQQIIDLLYRDLFNIPSNGCLEEWYDLMTNNVNSSNNGWNNIVPKPINGKINVDSKKKDALFECDKNLFKSSSITPLFSYSNFGHDVPVWVSNGNIENMIRIMIVSQDPLRNRGINGKILFSSPFGIHCHDYRNKKNESLMKILQGLWKDNKIVFYLTDFNKLYTQSGGNETSIQTLNRQHPTIVQNFKSILDKEIDLFKPNLIVTLADYTSNNLLGRAINTENRFKKHTYNGIDVLPMYHIAEGRVAIYRKKKYIEVNTMGKYADWIDWYIDEISQCL